jgi:hypothetical protein
MDEAPGPLPPPAHWQRAVTDRLVWIMQQLADGRTPAELADELSVTTNAIFVALMRARRLFGAKNNTHLVVLALRDGVIEYPHASQGEKIANARRFAADQAANRRGSTVPTRDGSVTGTDHLVTETAERTLGT